MKITDKDILLIKKYLVNGPRYTSYPTAPEWKESFSPEHYSSAIDSFFNKNTASSLYVHFPYCPQKCFYCGCNSEIISNSDDIERYLSYIGKELELIKKHCDMYSYKSFRSLHIGGGSPSQLSIGEFEVLIKKLDLIIDRSLLLEFSIELDPRSVDEEKLEFYANIGINRISFGIQDFDQKVQAAIGRVQPLKVFKKLLTTKIVEKFRSINFDLIYGLPFQTRKSFSETVKIVKELNPTRIAIYNYAHMPHLLSNQSKINSADLPDVEERINIFIDTTASLLQSGYKFIGMDHFAKSTDDLAIAQKERRLHRNFMGYSAVSANSYLGLGPTAISLLESSYAQNSRVIDEYYAKLDKAVFPVFRGLKLTEDDLIRRDVIQSIICNFYLDFNVIEKKYAVLFHTYFKEEIEALTVFVNEGIIILKPDSFAVTELGKLFVRNICMLFDKYLKNSRHKSFSKTI